MLRLLYPPLCLLCRQTCSDHHGICPACREALPRLPPGVCPRCARILGDAQDLNQDCGICLQDPPAFDRTMALYRYSDEIVQVMHRMKFGKDPATAAVLGRLMAEDLQAHWKGDWPEAIIPIPLHRYRLWWRGFNQSLELAKPVSRILGIPILTEALVKTQSLVAQSSLNRAQRLRQNRLVFQVNIKNMPQRVVLLDDVMTTGATLNSAASSLKNKDCGAVFVWTFSRVL